MNPLNDSTDICEVTVMPWCGVMAEGFSNDTSRRSIRMATSLGSAA
jgi:hypothetical protein